MTENHDSSATAVLREEHQLILSVAHHLKGMLAADRDGAPLDYDTVGQCITFFRLFADACHHGKEEDLLFPGMEAQGMSRDTGPIAVMLYEHDQGRAFVATMAGSLEGARSGDNQAGDDLRTAADGFISLIVDHISKEDNILFNMADGMIVGAECVKLCAGYEEVCGRTFEGRTKEDLERLAEEIL
ncbi:MAG: hemerythrin domain-containing protein [Actinomycetota bacterium]|nr:hemerythrin domain-containing protein [Actinomycetota bacterium]